MEWNKADDKLPPVETEVLIWPRPELNDLEVIAGFYRAGWEQQWACYTSSYAGVYETNINVTHWMPLPPPPVTIEE